MAMNIASGALPIVPLSFKGHFAANATTTYTCDKTKEKVWIILFTSVNSTINVDDGTTSFFAGGAITYANGGIIMLTYDDTDAKWYCVPATGNGSARSDTGTIRIITSANTVGNVYVVNSR